MRKGFEGLYGLVGAQAVVPEGFPLGTGCRISCVVVLKCSRLLLDACLASISELMNVSTAAVSAAVRRVTVA
jgi:hypothetical protein